MLLKQGIDLVMPKVRAVVECVRHVPVTVCDGAATNGLRHRDVEALTDAAHEVAVDAASHGKDARALDGGGIRRCLAKEGISFCQPTWVGRGMCP